MPVETSVEAEKAIEMRVRYLILLLLADKPKTGYEIMRTIRDFFSSIGGSASPGTIYPVLHQLVEEGLVNASDEPRGARPRKVYRITDKGIEYLVRVAQRALEALEAAMRLHLNALRGIREPRTLSPAIEDALADIIERLHAIKTTTDELIRIVEKLTATIRHRATKTET